MASRPWRRTKRGVANLELQVEEGGAFRTLSEGEGIVPTQERIDELLAMNYDTFVNSAFILQGRADEFTEKKASERKEILGQTVHASLADVPAPIDMVDVFRNSDAALAVTQEALQLSPLPKVIWMQLSVTNDEAAKLAEAAGVRVVMNRCPKIEYGRLFGELSWSGVNSGVISSKRRKVG